MLNSTEANLLINKLNNSFAEIGVGQGTAMPISAKNTEHVAWELHVAMHLFKMAEGRKKSAMKAAVKAGLVFDHEKEPMPAGTNQSIYNGDVVQIGVAVKQGSLRLNEAAFIDALVAEQCDRAMVERLAGIHRRRDRSPHTFTTSLVTSGG